MSTLFDSASDSVAVTVTDEPSVTGFGEAERETVGRGTFGVPVVETQLLPNESLPRKILTSTTYVVPFVKVGISYDVAPIPAGLPVASPEFNQVFVFCTFQRTWGKWLLGAAIASDGLVQATVSFPSPGVAVRLVTGFGLCACAGAAANSDSAPSSAVSTRESNVLRLCITESSF